MCFNKWFIRIVSNSTWGLLHWDDHPRDPCSKAASRWPRIYENLRHSGWERGFGNFCESQKKGVEKIGLGMIGAFYFPR